MNKRLKTLLAASLALGFVGGSQAQVTGEFVDLGGNLFGFQVTNNTATDWTGFDFGGAPGTGDGGFAGNFNQPFGDGTISFNAADGNFNGETFFSFAPGLTSVNVIDSATSLEGAFDTGGDILLGAGNTEIVAIFSTDGTTPTFIGGSVQNQAGVQEIVPEPGSLALLGLGGLTLLRRRRR